MHKPLMTTMTSDLKNWAMEGRVCRRILTAIRTGKFANKKFFNRIRLQV